MRNRLTFSCACVLALGACGGDDGNDPDRPFGDTAIVVVVNQSF